MITVKDNIITVTTKTLDAVLENGALVRLCDKSGNKYITESPKNIVPVGIVYRKEEVVPLDYKKCGGIFAYSISNNIAEVRIDAWDGHAILTISEDCDTGDLCIEPEVSTTRQGVLGCRYLIDGINPDYRIVAPLFQGIDMKLTDPLLHNHKWAWPQSWEAGFAILHNHTNGFWIRCEDDKYRYKALVTGCGEKGSGLSFDSEAYGPIEKSLSAGGICWRINVFEGTWRVPATQYKKWLWETYKLDKQAAIRKEWISQVKLAVSWCPTDIKILKELEKLTNPQNVLLHLPFWRKHGYDQGYPDFTPSAEFLQFMEYASARGFHCMPHANSIDIDPTMPEYKFVSDFKYRDIENGKMLGWGWQNNSAIGIPSSNKLLTESRDKFVMVKIHPGIALWRSILVENIGKSINLMKNMTDAMFLDVVLCISNLDNCLVDNMTPAEGMNRIISHIQSLGNGLVVGGEGLNEITAQHLSFGQVHLFNSYHNSIEGLERCGGCDLSSILFDGLCKSFGYANLSGESEDHILRERIHEEHGCIPTITINNCEQLENPNTEFRRIFKMINN